nr:hypothetical protein [Desulforamulus aquiferis]
MAGNVLASPDSSGNPHAGHDMSNVNSTKVQEELSHDNHGIIDNQGVTSSHDHSTTSGGHDSANDHEANNDGHDTNNAGHGHGSNSEGHGESKGDPNAPPNWSAIYGFGAFNLLVIIIAAVLKFKTVRNGVN